MKTSRITILLFLVTSIFVLSLAVPGWLKTGAQAADNPKQAKDPLSPGSAASRPAGKTDPRRGKPFTDPNKVCPMPDDWLKQPIKYESWANGADLAVTIDQQIYTAILPIVMEFGKKNGIKIAVEEGTCGTSAGAVQRKTVDVSAMCCPPGDIDRLPGLRYHTIGISSLALFVNKANTIKNVSTSDVRNLFGGKTRKWSELKIPGGQAAPNVEVKPVVRLHCKSRPGHWCLILANESLFSKNALEVGSIIDMLNQTASLRGAIGYETLWMIEHYGMKDKLNVLNVDGYSPYDHGSVISGKYSLYRTMNLTSWDAPGIAKPQAKKLVEYILSNLDRIDKSLEIIPAPLLKKAGWQFTGDELTGEPF
ncbi:MAG: hypothetical protein HQK89_17490 [Nitrospirae bacterium]|nr:hypothetical protein [Nitrospirota bacterium]